jgi:hypothetical protein
MPYFDEYGARGHGSVRGSRKTGQDLHFPGYEEISSRESAD